ncbi:carbon-nitrogen hydrolase family protein [Megasphaera paucivorans]|uniref:Predicted amidohydrolase n=1 Tax=Megasphaera paucivorans TaxID=349095 RepID=A0A1G9SF97_9FIRM|nr:carbon-nitrogen hydrolase family protein [Megasphaera paucivorans]SDM34153.1 Predicted amidohydrolase [Megasphaera paucivorans]
MLDIIGISVVTFQAQWGKKEENLQRMLGYIEHAARQGSDLIVFSEMSLTGYDDEGQVPAALKMQTRLAETIPGPASEAVAQAAKAHGIYVLFGMPEMYEGRVYNSLAACSPEGTIVSYKKMHLPLQEPNWAAHGDTPLLLPTPWGPIGCSICYDAYSFPELIRYYAAKGCRLYINATAFAKSRNPNRARTTLEASVLREDIYIATANLGGVDLVTDFLGGSSIMGPSRTYGEVHYYAGRTFDDPAAPESEMYSAVIDLTLASRSLYVPKEGRKEADFRPACYAAMYTELTGK